MYLLLIIIIILLLLIVLKQNKIAQQSEQMTKIISTLGRMAYDLEKEYREEKKEKRLSKYRKNK